MTVEGNPSVLLDRLKTDQKESLRGGQKERLSIIRMALSAIRNAEIEKGKGAVLTDAEVVVVLSSMVRKLDEAIEQYEKAGRTDLAGKEAAERDIIREYLPSPLSESELESLVEEAVRETGASSPRDMGAIMKWLAPKTSGRADNRVVSQKVKTRLGA